MSKVESPAQTREAATKTRAVPPMPLLRQILTVNPPDVPMAPYPVTIEVIILSDSQHEDTASASDLPELQEAGWSKMSLGPVEVCVRVIG